MDISKDIKGAIFDLDGTLLDSLWIWEDIDRRFLAKRGIAVPPDYMKAVSAMEYRQASEYTIARFGLNETPQSLMDEWTEMAVSAYARELKIKPRVEKYLNDLHRDGIKLAVATSATPDMCLPALENNGIAGLFDAVVSTFEIGKGKTCPDVYLVAAARIGLTPDKCAVYEDNLNALKTAKNAGFFTVGVYDKYSAGDEAELRATADIFIAF